MSLISRGGSLAPRLLLLALALVAGGCRGGDSASDKSKTPGKLTLAVIPKGSTHIFWKSVEAGARKAADELGVDIAWKSSLKENDRATQIAIVEQFTSDGVDGIVLAPLDDIALRRPVDAAMRKKIPVLIFDSALHGAAGMDFVGYVGTDNRASGQLAGEEMVRLLSGKGKVIVLRYMEGSNSTMEREDGFLETIKKHPEMEIALSNRFAGGTMGEAKEAALNIIDQLREVDGVFCSCEPVTFGMMLALKQNGLTPKVKIIGFDTADKLIEGLQSGDIAALVAQNPTQMGYLSVKNLVEYIHGKSIPESIDSGAMLITRENLDHDDVRKFLGKAPDAHADK